MYVHVGVCIHVCVYMCVRLVPAQLFVACRARPGNEAMCVMCMCMYLYIHIICNLYCNLPLLSHVVCLSLFSEPQVLNIAINGCSKMIIWRNRKYTPRVIGLSLAKL